MFFFSNKRSKLIKEAQELSRLGHKVYHYRRDLLEEESVSRIKKTVDCLDEQLGDRKAEIPAIEKAKGEMEAVLEKYGDVYYHQRGLNDNIELFLMAAIIAIGVRTFFFQPFKIPTNSMYPTYNGFTYKFYEDVDELPNPVQKIFRFALYGASHYEVKAPADGELFIPLRRSGQKVGSSLFASQASGLKFFVLPTMLNEFIFFVDGQPATVKVPSDFRLDELVKENFVEGFNLKPVKVPGLGMVLKTGKLFKKGDTMLAFDILSGDALFVDRISYHFKRPEIGDPFVFRTQNIETMSPSNRNKYYIKRLVGQGGDELQVKYPTLYRNGKPIEGAGAFEKNATKEGEYEGYTPMGRQGLNYQGTVTHVIDRPIRVPDGYFFAMGDNSDQSSDSRYWGYVPQSEVIGKAAFIYWPFSEDWGRAK